jgi:hypothetical protein
MRFSRVMHVTRPTKSNHSISAWYAAPSKTRPRAKIIAH